MKNLIRVHCLATFLFVGSLMAPSGAQAGPLAGPCIAACITGCWATVCKHAIAVAAVEIAAVGLIGAPFATLKAGIKCKLCKAACLVGCAPSCFAEGSKVTLWDNGVNVETNIESVKAGDTVLTLVGGNPTWTKVTRNLRIQGDFDFVQVTTQNLKSGIQRKITVTPEHGLVLVNENGQLTLDSAANILVGDRMLSSNKEEVSVTDVLRIALSEKYSLETSEGTVLASDLLVTTICSEEVSGGERQFEPTMKDWCLRHNCSGGQ